MLDTKHKSSDSGGMNKLPLKTRVQILTMLCEGSSMRSISRVADVSINTVSKLLVDAGKFCADLHDRKVRYVTAKRVRCDESAVLTSAALTFQTEARPSRPAVWSLAGASYINTL